MWPSTLHSARHHPSRASACSLVCPRLSLTGPLTGLPDPTDSQHGASAAFMSPFGYQTNLMVYGAGGYNFMDFVRFGAPLQIVGAVVSLLAAAFMDHWYILAAVSLSAVVVVLGGKLAWEASRDAWRAKHQEHGEHRAGLSMFAWMNGRIHPALCCWGHGGRGQLDANG